ncbi:MAG: hypothetical protein WA702_02745 [Bradyrhizobium sp.]|uniref:hypothetical protein n=1 Tax=Bradyrhizobium sp. TaxID=376 RepID=UPI003C7BA795
MRQTRLISTDTVTWPTYPALIGTDFQADICRRRIEQVACDREGGICRLQQGCLDIGQFDPYARVFRWPPLVLAITLGGRR